MFELSDFWYIIPDLEIPALLTTLYPFDQRLHTLNLLPSFSETVSLNNPEHSVLDLLIDCQLAGSLFNFFQVT